MQVVMHVGPHKTGTTSIQRHLVGRIGSAEPMSDVWYPQPESRPPGHAELALPPPPGGPDPLASVVEQAETAGVERLVLSSEDFVGLVPDHLDRLADALRGHEVLLVTTQGPILRRLVSLWQEAVKHGRTEDRTAFFAAFPEIQPARLGSPYRPGFWSGLVEALQPTGTVVVYVDPEAEPSALIRDATRAMSLPPPRADDEKIHERANEGLGLVEVEMLRRMNVLLTAYATADEGDVRRALRIQAVRLFKSPDWARPAPRVPIVASAATRSLATRLWQDFRDDLAMIEAHCPVEEIGSPRLLGAGLEHAEEVVASAPGAAPG